MKTKILATLVVLSLLGAAILGLRHIKNLDNQIQLKQIDLKDNSARLKLLDTKYIELNKELEAKDVDKAKVEQQLKDLQIERDKLQADLQAKRDAKAKDIAVKASQAVGAPQVAYAGTCGDNQYANQIYMQESGCRLTAVNSIGCIGIGQSCPASKLASVCPDWQTNYDCQNRFFTAYAMSYGSWQQAHAFKYCKGSCYSTRTKVTTYKTDIWW